MYQRGASTGPGRGDSPTKDFLIDPVQIRQTKHLQQTFTLETNSGRQQQPSRRPGRSRVLVDIIPESWEDPHIKSRGVRTPHETVTSQDRLAERHWILVGFGRLQGRHWQASYL